MPTSVTAFYRSLCGPGLLLGSLFFAASLTPSLVPRASLLQAVLSGLCFASGYGIGYLMHKLWCSLGWPGLSSQLRTPVRAMNIAISALAIGLSLWWAATWQNRLRALMHLPEIDSAGVLTILGGAIVVFSVMLMLARLFKKLRHVLSGRMTHRVPAPTAMVFAVVVTASLFWMVGNGVLARSAMHFFDEVYSELDSRLEDNAPQPTDGLKTGGPNSLIPWSTLGMQGRRMVAGMPNRAQIVAITEHEAKEPLRVYVGLASADTPQSRAELALAELKRIGAFDRSNLVIATPTGTGWVDQESQQALEYLLFGDVATVSVQYSYLASWLALLTNPDYGVETARAVFSAVYGHWRTLQKDKRPRLYLYGLSLGALNTDLSHDLHQVIADPYQGVLFAGPPFNTPVWKHATASRQPGTPAWLPRVGDGSTLRFTSQQNHLEDGHAPWGPLRMVFLQYASDSITFFDPQTLWRKPEWMHAPLGPDVAPDMVWLPVISFLQLSFDVMVSVSPPLGFGHVYAFEHYVDAWASLTGPSDYWTAARLDMLKKQQCCTKPD